MSMKELEKMVRRAKGNWKLGCNDRNAAEYSIGVVNAATNVVAQYDGMLAEAKGCNHLPLVKAMENLRDALYPIVRAEVVEGEPEMERQVGVVKTATEFVNPFDKMREELKGAA